VKLDAVFHGTPRDAAEEGARLERLGVHGMWSLDTGHNPFMPLLLASEHTSRLEVGTGVAVALARSPMTLAQEAWDLAAFSKGRFKLGLGSQVQAHIVKRFSMPWENPIEQMRDMIGALRAIWQAFQGGGKLKYEGRYYKHTLLTPFFSPGPIEHPDIPILLAGVGPRMTGLAGEAADGYMLHPFTNDRYFEQVTAPALEAGLKKAGRDRSAFTVAAPVFIITGDERQQKSLDRKVREQIAFYGSTPAYHEVLAVVGLEDLGKELHRMSRAGEWQQMGALVTDEIVNMFAVRASLDELPQRLIERWGGKVDRLVAHFPLPDEMADGIRQCADALEGAAAPA
jgi:probable F420-dependent oxidoreductase